MSRREEGLKSDALRAALGEALQGRAQTLEQLLCRHGGLPGLRPNLKLAAAFGAELAQQPMAAAAPLLERLGSEIAAPDDPRVFLPIAAAHGWTQRLRADPDLDLAWSSLQPLAADERSVVRVGTLDALRQLCATEGMADSLVAHSQQWFADADLDRELAFGASALALDVLADPRVLGLVRAPEPLLELATSMIDQVADAPRSASRSDARRRLLTTLSITSAHLVAGLRAGDRGAKWFAAECERATHPDIRAALSQALLHLATLGHAPARAVIDELRRALEGSAKPLRDAARVRTGSGRGRRSRQLR